MGDRFEFETALGEIWMWGRDTGRPICLVITGAFAEPHVYDRLQLVLPDFDVLRTHLPGNHSPTLLATSVGVFAAALAQAVAKGLSGRPLIIVGVSTGALVAMAVRSPDLKALMLIEPFLRTRHVTAFSEMLPVFTEPAQREFLWSVLGVREGEAVERDYRHLVTALTVPGAVMLGASSAMPPSPAGTMPSLVDDADRATLRAQPLLTIYEIPGSGHNVAAQNTGEFAEILAKVARYAADGPTTDSRR